MDDRLHRLSNGIDELIDLVYDLRSENDSLKLVQEQLAEEKARLLRTNEEARTRIQTMVERLRLDGERV